MGSEKHVKPLTVLAAVAHPDDIEFMMAGTLILLKQAGATLHMWNLANGCCGTDSLSHDDIVQIRHEEAKASADLIGATLHPPLADDLMLFFDHSLLVRAAAIIRSIRPDIILVPSPDDYMEDHQNACRLVVSAAFYRGMRNYVTVPPVDPWGGDMAIYHALPNGLHDSLRRKVEVGQYVDITTTLATKRAMLAQHKSQKDWLDVSQGLDSYLITMQAMSRETGRMSGCFEFAEGWRRHLHLGYGPAGWDPMKDALKELCTADTINHNAL